MEDHYDDLGDNLSGLGGDLEYHMADVAIAPHEEDDSTDRIDEECIQGMLTWWFRGEVSLPQCPPDTMIAGNLEQLMTLLAEAGPGLDMCELCGGEARATTVAVRRRLKTGKNFDLVTHVDLNDPTAQRQVQRYIEKSSFSNGNGPNA